MDIGSLLLHFLSAIYLDVCTSQWEGNYIQAKCFLKAKCFGTVTPCHNSQTKKDNGLKIGLKVDHIDGIADKKS